METINYDLIARQLDALLEGETDLIANLSNASALLNESMSDINWLGFYLIKQNELLLGPFQGKPACVHIPIGKGVCGTAVSEAKVLRIDDVNEFPGHIACDAMSQSEIVLPIYQNGEIMGVLDIDAPITNRFTQHDEAGLKQVVTILEKHL